MIPKNDVRQESIIASSFHLLRRASIFLSVFVGLIIPGHTFMQIQLGPGVPESVEQALIAQTTSQFNVTLTSSPFFANTFTLVVKGLNPNYNPPPTNMDYPYGWAAGVSYQQSQEEKTVGAYGVLCSSPTAFNLTQTSPKTFDLGTCQDTLATLDDNLFLQSLSTTPVLGF